MDDDRGRQAMPQPRMKYRPLRDSDFRLLRILPKSNSSEIHGTLSHHRFPSFGRETCVQYTALSYCWGSPKSSRSITLDGVTFPVTANLFIALEDIIQHHMPAHDTLFWIDAICIDQNNLEEKAQQVRQMWRIFENASVVYAWLGKPDRDVQILDESKLSYGDEPDPLQTKAFSDVNTALLNLSRRTYFTRTWTRPEFLRAKVLLLISGKYHFDWNWVMKRIEAWPKRRKHEVLPANAYQMFLSRGQGHDTNARQLSSPERLAELIQLYSRTGCSDPRDRIYSMLSDPSWPKLKYATWWIEPDYRLSNEELALLILAYYDYLVKWDDRMRDPMPVHPTREREAKVCDSTVVALETTRTKVRSLAPILAQKQGVARPDRLSLGHGFEVECVGPVLSSIWHNNGIWQERPG